MLNMRFISEKLQYNNNSNIKRLIYSTFSAYGDINICIYIRKVDMINKICQISQLFIEQSVNYICVTNISVTNISLTNALSDFT